LGTDAPAALFLDNGGTHISLAISELAAAHNLKLLTFVPHCTHVLQPIDVCFAHPFKREFTRFYRQLSREGVIEDDAGISRFTGAGRERQVVARAMISAYQKTSTLAACGDAFRKCGLAQRTWAAGKPVWDGPDRRSPVRQNWVSDPEQEARAAAPHHLHTGSTDPASAEFIDLLRSRQRGMKAGPPIEENNAIWIEDDDRDPRGRDCRAPGSGLRRWMRCDA
jgi:hypothetical protein